MALDFKIQLPIFEGPFDLLLFFIERDELDIYDIPISKVTTDFLEYISCLGQMNLEVASDFIWVAARLMAIKAKMLLPRLRQNEEGETADPRAELVRHLLDYKKYKSVLKAFQDMEESQLESCTRGSLAEETGILNREVSNEIETELQDLTLFKLMKAFQKAMQRFSDAKPAAVHRVLPYPYTVTEKKKELLLWIKISPQLGAVEIMARCFNKVSFVFTFLAVLELVQAGKLSLFSGDGFNDFIVASPEFEMSAQAV